jgi:hypothetical protein
VFFRLFFIGLFRFYYETLRQAVVILICELADLLCQSASEICRSLEIYAQMAGPAIRGANRLEMANGNF